MSNNLPSRGPRVMHGMSASLKQAQDLSPLLRNVLSRAAQPAQAVNYAEQAAAEAALNALAQRTVDAETQVGRVRYVLEHFRNQTAQQPEGSGARTLTESILDTFEHALTLPRAAEGTAL